VRCKACNRILQGADWLYVEIKKDYEDVCLKCRDLSTLKDKENESVKDTSKTDTKSN
jgi:phage FluMu protein Com